jgi:hypothetical protein
MAEQTEVHTVADWITDGIGEGLGSIMIKTREPHGDPVELSHDEAIELLDLLQKLTAQIA